MPELSQLDLLRILPDWYNMGTFRDKQAMWPKVRFDSVKDVEVLLGTYVNEDRMRSLIVRSSTWPHGVFLEHRVGSMYPISLGFYPDHCRDYEGITACIPPVRVLAGECCHSDTMEVWQKAAYLRYLDIRGDVSPKKIADYSWAPERNRNISTPPPDVADPRYIWTPLMFIGYALHAGEVFRPVLDHYCDPYVFRDDPDEPWDTTPSSARLSWLDKQRCPEIDLFVRPEGRIPESIARGDVLWEVWKDADAYRRHVLSQPPVCDPCDPPKLGLPFPEIIDWSVGSYPVSPSPVLGLLREVSRDELIEFFRRGYVVRHPSWKEGVYAQADLTTSDEENLNVSVLDSSPDIPGYLSNYSQLILQTFRSFPIHLYVFQNLQAFEKACPFRRNWDVTIPISISPSPVPENPKEERGNRIDVRVGSFSEEYRDRRLNEGCVIHYHAWNKGVVHWRGIGDHCSLISSPSVACPIMIMPKIPKGNHVECTIYRNMAIAKRGNTGF